MSDLTGKFAALKTQMADQHTALMQLLTDIHTDSSALAQTLLTIRDTTGDIHLDTQSMDLKLLTIRDTTGDIHLDTQSMDLKLLTIRDTTGDIHLDTQSIDLKLLDVRNTLTYIYSQVLNLAPGTFDWAAVMGTPSGSADNVLAWLAQTIDSLGQPTGDATTTVLGRLSAIETLSFNYLPLIATNTGKCPCGATPPEENNICSDPYVSTGMALVPSGIIPGFSSTTVAIWGNTPPAQIEYGTVFGTVSDNSSLVPSSGQSWVGRSIFVESSADNFALQTLGTARYSTNTWVDLTPQDTAEISVMVDPGASVRAYICGDLGYGPGGGGGGSWGGGGGGGGSWGAFTDCWTPTAEQIVSVHITNTLSGQTATYNNCVIWPVGWSVGSVYAGTNSFGVAINIVGDAAFVWDADLFGLWVSLPNGTLYGDNEVALASGGTFQQITTHTSYAFVIGGSTGFQICDSQPL